MLIEIFDVGHGACAMITSPNGRRMMVDCGTNPERSFWPSVYYFGKTIDVLVISNFDEDHVSDFSGVMTFCNVLRHQMNFSVSAAALAQMKAKAGMGPGIQAVHRYLSSLGPGSLAAPLDFSPVAYRVYHNRYGAFDDPNNLILVLIVEYAGFKIIFPGDLEVMGWRQLLADPSFAQDLIGANVFVASHHGRKTGCCEEVFRICRPEIVIMSDRDKQFDSQETAPWYQQRTRGIRRGNQIKYVYTTRTNGHMSISVDPDGTGMINTET